MGPLVQYTPGRHLLAVGQQAFALVDDSALPLAPEMVADIFAAVLADGPLSRLLDLLLVGGFRAMPPLALGLVNDESLRLILRGLVAELIDESGRPLTVSGLDVSTVLEHTCAVPKSLSIGGVDGVELPLISGVARAGGLRWASVAASTVTAPAVPAPAVPAPAVPAPAVPAPAVPAPAVPAPAVPAPAVPAPAVAAPTVPGPTVPVPSVPQPPVAAPTVPAPTVPEPSVPQPPVAAQTVPEPAEPSRPTEFRPQPIPTDIALVAPAVDLHHTRGEEPDDEAYSHLWEETVMRSAEEAAVRPPDPDHQAQIPVMVTSVPNFRTAIRPSEETAQVPVVKRGDHDGFTVMGSSVAHILPPRPVESDNRIPARLRLRFSTGQLVTLDRPVVVGRQPTVGRVSGAEMPQLIVVAQSSKEISRTHIEFRMVSGELIATDLSSNGSVLTLPSGEVRQLIGGARLPLIAGTQVDVGDGVLITVEGSW